MKELNYHIKTSANKIKSNSIKTLGYIQDASANIYSLTNLTIPIWTGIVNSVGKVVDTFNNSPYLSYGDYRILIEKCDYDTESLDFRVPDASIVNLSIGCSSAITAHETFYDHSKLTSGLILPPGIGPLPYAGANPPSGWLLCNGSAISRTNYAGLFAVIGTSFGIGDGSTTFNIPDMRGRVPVGLGASGVINRGDIGGEQNHTLNIAEMPAHTHSGYGLGNSQIGIGTGNPPMVYSTGSAGGGQTHNNMQPYLGVNYIISI